MPSEDEVFQRFMGFTNFIENQYNTTIKVFRSDNGTEYINKIFFNYLHQKGFYIKLPASIHQNKMTFQKRKIDIF
jgi:hypothetical protein